ncbi:MAG: TonB-dependent receptor [Bacteroidetes bacterium]|nr:MAG: TonB-dependent receptor [Bacteroidota bacterium]
MRNVTIAKYMLMTIMLVLSISESIQAQTLQGIVIDDQSKEVLPGATIYIPDLRTGAVTDLNGKYFLNNLPKRKLLIQVRLIGYSTLSQTIDLNLTTVKDFSLRVSIIEKNEIVVTGSAFTTDAKRTSVAITPVDKIKILSTASDNLVQSLSNIPGISTISTGNSISKPVIRGLGYNRVVVVNEGIRQEGQQWGDEHGLEIDQYSADRIEILKGPSSLLYGSDALGGVINILEPILPSPGKIRAEINSQFSSNNSLSSNSVMTEGNAHGFTWRARASYKNAAPYKTPIETVYNSAYEEKSVDALLGLHRQWGYSHIHASKWYNTIGITEGERDSLSGKMLDENGNVPTENKLHSRSVSVPFQDVSHSKISAVNNFIIGKSQLRFNIGVQQNNRKEFSVTKESPEISLKLNTVSYDLKYYLPEVNNLETAIGISGMRQLNENLGREFLIPDYQLDDIGIFSSLRKSFDLTTLNAGLRYDHRTINSEELNIDSLILFDSFNRNYSSISASVGVTHKLSQKVDLKANLGRGFRSPNIPELASNGIHEGTQRFEKGNKNLKSETSLQFDLGISYDSKSVELSLNLFLNNIDNFIYSRNIDGETMAIDGIDYPVYSYIQGQSTLKGGEFTLDIHPIKNLHFENSLSYVHGQNEAGNEPLTLIPPMKIVNELKFEIPSKNGRRLQEPYLKLELVSSLSQNRIDQFETKTKGYSLVNIGIGSHIRMDEQTALFFIRISNLLNTSYFDHLSRMKEIGVNGPGRSISLGLMVPIGIK